jgi:hypothetical protein
MGPGYFNRYAYTGNDPVNHTDPDGEAFVFGAVFNMAVESAIILAENGGDIGSLATGDSARRLVGAGAAGALGVGVASRVATVGRAGARAIARSSAGQALSARGAQTANAVGRSGDVLVAAGSGAAGGVATEVGTAAARGDLGEANLGAAALGGSLGGGVAQGVRQVGAQVASSGVRSAPEVRSAGVVFARGGSVLADATTAAGAGAADASQSCRRGQEESDAC